jgi:hypothetical protein
MSILYDYPTLENEHDKTLANIQTFINRLSAASTPGAHLVEVFPWMIHIPKRYGFIFHCLSNRLESNRLDRWNIRFAKWKREAMEHFGQHSAMFNGLFNTVSDDIVSRSSLYALNILESLPFQAKGSERPSVSASLIKSSDRSGLSNTEIAWLIGSL